MDGLLASLDGPSNWLTGSERLDRLVHGGTKLLATIAVITVGVVALVRKLRRK